MKQHPQIFLGIGMVVVLLLLAVLLLDDRPNADTEQRVQNAVDTVSVDATLQAEREILLQLTAQPDAALSVTPYYAEILFNEAVRYFTVTPTLDPFQPTPACWLYPDFWQLPDVAQNINTVLEQRNFQATTEVFVSAVWNASECDTYIPVANRVRIWVEDEGLVRANNDNFLTILDEVANSIGSANPEEITVVEAKIYITVSFSYENRAAYLSTNLGKYNEIRRDDLLPGEIIGLLGGIQEWEWED